MFGKIARLPDDEDEDTDVANVNTGSEGIDEDGEAVEGHEDPVDNSATIHSLALKCSHTPQMALPQTEIIATIHTPTGLTSKRMVIPGAVTTQRLAALLDDVTAW